MQTIDQHSKAIIDFSLSWNDGNIHHHESYRADPVSFWRDIVPPSIYRDLLGKDVGGQAKTEIGADRFPQPYDPKKRVAIRPEQFQGVDRNGNTIALREGRYYPQGLLTGLTGVFRVSTAPCRYLGRDGERLIFDLNHPLAGHDLSLQAEVVAFQSQRKEKGGRCEDWLERICADGPGMQTRIREMTDSPFSHEDFRRPDERPDGEFYDRPRLVHHLDSLAREEISRQYGRLIPVDARVLDLMGSWASHLPDNLALDGLTVLGMNAEELQQNPRATATVVHDLNREARLPFADGDFTAVICTASIEYLARPLAVLTEIRRVLRPGGLLAMAFSNRWFPPKVIRIWPGLHEFERLGLVIDMLVAAGGFHGIHSLSRRGLPRPADDPHQELFSSDPVFMVWGHTDSRKTEQ